jgi:hypothetical protein
VDLHQVPFDVGRHAEYPLIRISKLDVEARQRCSEKVASQVIVRRSYILESGTPYFKKVLQGGLGVLKRAAWRYLFYRRPLFDRHGGDLRAVCHIPHDK